MPANGPEIDAGALDRRVTLLRPVYANEFEDEISGFEAVTDVWAAVNPQTGREQNEASRTVATTEVPIIIRYRTDIDARWRIQDRDVQFEVKSKLDIARRHVQLQLNCEEVQ